MDKVFSLEPRYDAVIIGARCAGAATALLLARSAAKVLWSIGKATAPIRCRRTP
jgi:glycine/D-amino acid oxidase-like deaminating enzyme